MLAVGKISLRFQKLVCSEILPAAVSIEPHVYTRCLQALSKEETAQRRCSLKPQNHKMQIQMWTVSIPEDGAAQILLLCSVRYCNRYFKNSHDELVVVSTSAKTEVCKGHRARFLAAKALTMSKEPG